MAKQQPPGLVGATGNGKEVNDTMRVFQLLKLIDSRATLSSASIAPSELREHRCVIGSVWDAAVEADCAECCAMKHVVDGNT